MNNYFHLILLMSLLLLANCVRSTIEHKEEALRLYKNKLEIKDKLAMEPFIEGIKDNIEFLANNNRFETMQFGQRSITKDDYLLSLQALIEEWKLQTDRDHLFNFLIQNFDVYEVYGYSKWGEVFITGYFEPVVEGSLAPTIEFSQPLYQIPNDLVNINIGNYQEKFPDYSIFKSLPAEKKLKKYILRGRYIKGEEGKGAGKVVPYFDRKEIDQDGKLGGKNLELVYMDPVDAFFTQIQGSGSVLLEDGNYVRLGYAAQNGHPYVAIGKFLLDIIPLEKMSLQSIRAHLATISLAKMQELFNKNPSYVFFKPLEGKPLTYLGTEVVDHRTIATDKNLMPFGTIGYLEVEVPDFENKVEIPPKNWISEPRLVIGQDTGGAIRGPGRVDLYFGSGKKAGQSAGVMRHKGKLFYFAPKVEWLKELKK